MAKHVTPEELQRMVDETDRLEEIYALESSADKED